MGEPTFAAERIKLDLSLSLLTNQVSCLVGYLKWNSIVILWALSSLLIGLDWQCPDLNMVPLLSGVS